MAIVRPEELNNKNTTDLIGNRIRDPPTCNAVSQLTMPLRNRDVCSKHKRKIQISSFTIREIFIFLILIVSK